MIKNISWLIVSCKIMKKIVMRFLYVLLLFIFLFIGFVLGVTLMLYSQKKELQVESALSACSIIKCTELLRNGQTEDAIKGFDSLSSNQLYYSAYHKDHTEMMQLPENILVVWQEAKIYYEKYDVQGRPHCMVGPVKKKLEYVAWSQPEKIRRQFDAKYKGPNLQVVPELEIVQWFGQQTSLAEQTGNIVLLDFWGTQCSPCLKGMPKVQQLYTVYKDKGLSVIALTGSLEDNGRIQKIIAENNYTFNIAKATPNVFEEYAIVGIPTYFLVDKQSRLVWGPEHDTPSVEIIEKLLNNNPSTINEPDNSEEK